ncbi:MAG: hypothetical protein ABIJ96_08245 [Elusimicrobiota bacterium]
MQLLAAVWSKIQKGEKFTVVRTGTYTYAVVAESGTAIVETRGKF